MIHVTELVVLLQFIFTSTIRMDRTSTIISFTKVLKRGIIPQVTSKKVFRNNINS